MLGIRTLHIHRTANIRDAAGIGRAVLIQLDVTQVWLSLNIIKNGIEGILY